MVSICLGVRKNPALRPFSSLDGKLFKRAEPSLPKIMVQKSMGSSVFLIVSARERRDSQHISGDVFAI
jgi:hypothetical protein